MPEYQFENLTTGEPATLVYSMAEAPSIGDVVTHEGQQYRRLASTLRPQTEMVKYRFPVVSRALPKRLPGFQHDKSGRTVIRNHREKHEAAARCGYQIEE